MTTTATNPTGITDAETSRAVVRQLRRAPTGEILEGETRTAEVIKVSPLRRYRWKRRCADWVDSLLSKQRPAGVVAGTIHIPITADQTRPRRKAVAS
jgi:hypothetical protein